MIHINTLLLFCWKFCYKMFGHFGWPKITFDRISRHFRSIRNFHLSDFSTKWPPANFLDDLKSVSIAFLAISDQYATFIFLKFLSQNVRRRLFWMTENHFRSHFSPFQINTLLLFYWKFCHKMSAGCYFGWPKITFERISRHFISIRYFYLFWFFFHKMAASGHFGCPIFAKIYRDLYL